MCLIIAIISSLRKIVTSLLHLDLIYYLSLTLPTSERSYLTEVKNKLLKISFATSKEGGSPGLKTLYISFIASSFELFLSDI